MKKTGKKLAAVLLALAMAFMLMPAFGPEKAYASDDPAPIQDIYELDGVTYYDVGSSNFAVDILKFYKDMLGTRSDQVRLRGEYDEDAYEYKYYDQSEADLWLQTGVMTLTDLTPNALYSNSRCIQSMYHAALRGSYTYNQGSSMTYQATRYDIEGKVSQKAAEEWVFQKTFGSDQDFGYYKNETTEQMTLATAVNVKQIYNGNTWNTFTVAAYFTNFRVFALIPSDEGNNYVTELITDSVNSQFTTASTVKNLTASTVTGSQNVSNSVTVSVSNSVNGSETYSKSTSKKIGASYKFTDAFSVSGEASWTEGEAFSTGWGSTDSISKSKSVSYTVSVPLAPYTQAMITQSDTTSVYLTRYNCPIALLYDVTIVGYQMGDLGDGILHTSDTQILVDGQWIAIDRDAVFSFSDPMDGARGDLDNRIKSCESWSDLDEQGLRWGYIAESNPEQYDLPSASDAIAATRTHVPMSATGATYTQTLNVVASEVSGLMPTHPLYRVKIAEPSLNAVSDEISYLLFDYFTARMKVGEYSYANYMSLVGLNRYDVPFYGFSKDNGYWVITDKEGNELDPADSPVLLEKDPVSTNWRYTAVKSGTCYMVYRIDEDVYYTADRPNDPIKNDDLKKTAALEIIVTEGDDDHEHQMVRTKRQAPTCTELGNIEYYTCSVCGGIFRDKEGTEELSQGDVILPALGHNWTEWETEIEPTEEEEGLESRFCRNDPSHRQTRAIEKLPHKHVMVKAPKKLPTCTEDGNIMYYTCTSCDCVFTDHAGTHEIDPLDTILPATGHSWNKPSFTWNGFESATATRTCANDSGHTETVTCEVTSVVTEEPTATTEGIRTYTATAVFSDGTTATSMKEETIYWTPWTWTRLGGSNRYTTMQLIAGEAFPAAGSAKTIIVAVGNDWKTGLMAAGLAGALDAPFITVPVKASQTANLAPALEEIGRLASGDCEVLVLGPGKEADDTVLEAIREKVSHVRRVTADSAEALGLVLFEEGRGHWNRSGTVILASGAGFADSLSISPYAYASKTPIFYTNAEKTLGGEDLDFMTSGAVARVIIVGGTGSVSAEAEETLKAAGLPVLRLAGDNRYLTSAAIVKWELGLDTEAAFQPDLKMSVNAMGVATGTTYADALTCVDVLGRTKGVLLLTADNNNANKKTSAENIAEIVGNNKTLMKKAYIFGGTGSVSEYIEGLLNESIQ